jgi:hypothetical protein
MDKLARGTQVVYVPNHLKTTDPIEPGGLEPGFITNGPTNTGAYFVRYWQVRGKHFGPNYVLRTQANSELTPGENLVVRDTVPQAEVENALEKYC